MTWQQIFRGSLEVTVLGVCRVWLLNVDFLSGSATRQWRLIVVSHIHLCFVKISMSDAVAMFPRFEKSIVSAMW